MFKLVLVMLLTCCFATPPPGYVKPPETDEFPPKYEYEYKIEDNKGSGQGKLETRDGVFSSGRYYVQLGSGQKGATQNVQYFTDEWGYHPVVEYSSVGDHSQTSAQFALGEKAVEALKKNTANRVPLSNQIKQIPQTTNNAISITPPTVVQSVKPVQEVQEPQTIIFTLDTNNKNQPHSASSSNKAPPPVKQNVPVAQNVIPIQYFIQPQNIPQQQYVIPQQNNGQNMPQAQFLIEAQNLESNLPHPQFIVPVYQTELNSRQQHKGRILQNNFNNNYSPAQAIIVQQTKNQDNRVTNKDLQNKNIQSQKINTGNENIDGTEKEISSTEGQRELVGIINYETDQNVVAEQNKDFNEQENNDQQANVGNDGLVQTGVAINSDYVENNVQQSEIQSESHNNGQYLVEVTQSSIPEDNIQKLNQNVINLSQNEQENNNQAGNTVTNTIKQQNDVEQIDYLSQSAKEENNIHTYSNQNLQIQNTEALFGNTVSEVRYNTPDNYKVVGPSERTKYEETILNMDNFGGYGSRINIKNSNSLKNNNDFSATLIDRTKNLVTGVDVLNINDAVSEAAGEVNEQRINFDENKNGITDYSNIQYANSYPISISDINSYLLSNFNTNNNENPTQNSEFSQGKTISKTVLIPKVSEEASTSVTSEQSPSLPSTKLLLSQNEQEIQNGRNKLLQILNAEKVIPVREENDHISFAEKPIIVADLEQLKENSLQSTTENYQQQSRIEETVYSTTQNTIETKIAESSYESTDEPVLITPRPVSNSFLAPITAAVNLQNSKQDLEVPKKQDGAPGTHIEIQKSVPYYIGKVEYIENQKTVSNNQNLQFLTSKQLESLKSANIFGTHINSQLQEAFKEVLSEKESVQNDEDNYPKTEALIHSNIKHNNKQLQDQVQEQGQVQQEITVPFGAGQEIFQSQTKDIEAGEYPETVAEELTQVTNKPIEITKYVQKLYPVEIKVERIVEKPVEVTRVIEKPVQVNVPQPYPVEVEKIVERQIKVPVEVTRYVDKPYPVHIPYPQPIAIPVEVERIVETVVKEPYPVKVPVPVEVPIRVPVPHPIQITKYIEKPFPVDRIIEKPIAVEKIIEKPVPQYIEAPYPVPVHVAVPHPVAIPVEVKVPQPYPVEVTKYIEKAYGIPQPYPVPISKNVPYLQHVPVAVPVTKLIKVPVEVPKYIDRIVDRPYPIYVNLHGQQKVAQSPYLYAPKYQVDWKNINCDLNQNKQGQHFAKPVDYIGLVPPLKPATDFNNGHQSYKRKARNSFGQNLRIEYGFKPPIIPSVQTDEFGMPLNTEDQK